MLFYPAVFTQGECYITVTFSDIPSAITQGETQEEAFEMAQEVLGFALEDYEKYPKASDIVELQKQHPESTIAVIGMLWLLIIENIIQKKHLFAAKNCQRSAKIAMII